MVNDLRVGERLARPEPAPHPQSPAETCDRDLLGVKWLGGPQGQNSVRGLPLGFRYRRAAGRGNACGADLRTDTAPHYVAVCGPAVAIGRHGL
jgi:hypothetical protein